MKNTSAAVGVLAAGVLIASASGQSPCGIKQLFKRTGWDIPSLAGAVVVRHIGPSEPPDPVLVEVLEPSVIAASVMIVSRVPDEPGRVEIRDQPVDVQELRRYSVKGRIFAYRVLAGHVGIEGKERVALGSMEVLMYYDMDGTGLFKLRENASVIPYRIRVPDWVKALSGGR